MIYRNYRRLPVLALLWLATLPSALAGDLPDAVQALVERGIDIAGSFDAPGGMKGYVGSMQGQPVAFYLTPDEKHVVVGPMLDAAGRNLSEEHVQALVTGPENARAWEKLERADWIRDGAEDAPTVLYTFTDPNCPFCHAFRKAAEPWIDAGRVQLRHVMVGILKEDSVAKAATILGSDDPHAALRRHQARFDAGGINVDGAALERASPQVKANTQLMQSLRLRATPSTYFHDSEGRVRMAEGLPQPEAMAEIMGSERPAPTGN